MTTKVTQGQWKWGRLDKYHFLFSVL